MDKHTQMTDYELELLINEVEGTQMLEAPKRLKDEVLMKSRSIQTQTARQVTKASVRVELFLYGLKTAVAVAIAILLFGVVNQGTVEGMIPSADAMERDRNELGRKQCRQSLAMDRSDWKGRGIE